MIKRPSPFPSSLCDSHIHTGLGGHAIGEMEEYVQSPIKKGLKQITFLEHMEEGIERHQGKTRLSEDEFDFHLRIGCSPTK